MHRTWDAPRVTKALTALKDNGISVRDMTRMSGANRSTIYRWMSGGDGQPDYAIVNRLAAGVWHRFPHLARELVEASGYAWAEPAAPPEPDVLADELGQDTADRVRRELARRGEAGAIVLAEMERVLRPPASGPSASEPRRAAS